MSNTTSNVCIAQSSHPLMVSSAKSFLSTPQMTSDKSSAKDGSRILENSDHICENESFPRCGIYARNPFKVGVIINMASASGLYPMLPDPIYSGSKGAFELIQDERRAGACLWITNRRGMEYWPTPTEETKYRTKQPNARKVYSNIEKSYIQIPQSYEKTSGHYFGGSDQELSSRLPFDAGFEEEDKSTSVQPLQLSSKCLWLFVHMYQELAFSLRRIYHYDESAQTKFQKEKPWTNDPHYFKRVKISALALLKMVVHARSGGNIKIMGLMQGKTDGEAIIVMDAFALPVEGTETRVNAQVDAYEYMVDYSQTNKQGNVALDVASSSSYHQPRKLAKIDIADHVLASLQTSSIRDEFVRNDVSLMDRDHLGYSSPLTKVDEESLGAYNFSQNR
ncbi:hypothetical protein IFM89_006575 [Coptis chinensis]|uniref:COP9 signalosome complex subunit 5 n=1 Tax=Coptis chinensis TaxID=261450 RepID=A0A835M4J7_9MAGN|nr:hypothetical protein IFM89_006575 [Coptis chinensis]